MNSNLQSSVSLDVANAIREAAAHEGITVSQWVRETVVARLQDLQQENKNKADHIRNRMDEASKRYTR